MSKERGQIRCNCGLPAGKRTSWTDRNPGRRFMSCKFYEPESEWRGCNFFQWIDEDMTEWQRHLTNKLILEKKLLEVQLSTLQSEVNEWQCKRSSLLTENDNWKLKCKALTVEMKLIMKRGSNKGSSSIVGGFSGYFKVVFVTMFVVVLVVVGVIVLL